MTRPQVVRNALVVLTITALSVVAALGYTVNAPDRYAAAGTYVVGPASEITEPETIIRSFDSLQGQGIVPTLVELLSSETIARRVGAPLGLDRRAIEQYDVKASVLSASNTLELAVTGPDPVLTARLAGGIGTEASRVFEGLYSVYEIEPLDVPTAPDDKASPSLPRNLVLAALLGLTAGTGVVVLLHREAVRRRRAPAAPVPDGHPHAGPDGSTAAPETPRGQAAPPTAAAPATAPALASAGPTTGGPVG